MLVDKIIKVKLSTKTLKYWKSLGYHIPGHIDSQGREREFKRGSFLDVSPLDLPKKSNERVSAICELCGVVRTVVYSQYSKICHECNFKQRKGKGHYKYNHDNKFTGVDRQYDNHLRKHFKITYNTYLVMLENQRYKCAICDKSQAEIGKRLSVDHCHSSGKIRGLLCFSCNTGLGTFFDNVANLENAAKYIRNNNE